MSTVLAVASDLLREAASRKWFIGLALAITALLSTLAFSLRLEVVDGAIAATRLFGNLLGDHIRSADVALRPIFAAASALIFFAGSAFMIVACADFAPSLLSPGRIEHLLSLPVRRWQLLAGTYLGVLVLAAGSALYGAGGLAVILGVKTGVWTWKPLFAAGLAVVNFATLYAAMLAAAVFVRSTSFSAGAGWAVYAAGLVASFRHSLSPMFEEGLGRTIFDQVTLMLPRVSKLGEAAIQLASDEKVDLAGLASMMAAFLIFALGALAVGVWRFEQEDY